jgi:hypothetical protein
VHVEDSIRTPRSHAESIGDDVDRQLDRPLPLGLLPPGCKRHQTVCVISDEHRHTSSIATLRKLWARASRSRAATLLPPGLPACSP